MRRRRAPPAHLQVLSVVAQQLATIQGALKAGAERFNFEGREMRLVSAAAAASAWARIPATTGLGWRSQGADVEG
jgi:hypothetical protein